MKIINFRRICSAPAVTMTEEKSNNIPTFVMSTQESCQKKRSYKKIAIIAGSAIFGVAIIVTAVLVGFYLFSEAQKDIIKFSLTHRDNSHEEVTSDPDNNIVEHHVTSDSFEAWVVNDFNRNIEVVKVKTRDGTNCYVTPLNRTTAVDPTEVLKYNNPTAPNTTYYGYYQATKDPISDISFLCQKAQDTCKGISTYWMNPVCGKDEDKRKKRSWNFCWNWDFCWPVLCVYGCCYQCGCFCEFC